jgi:hypothetical protein
MAHKQGRSGEHWQHDEVLGNDAGDRLVPPLKYAATTTDQNLPRSYSAKHSGMSAGDAFLMPLLETALAISLSKVCGRAQYVNAQFGPS